MYIASIENGTSPPQADVTGSAMLLVSQQTCSERMRKGKCTPQLKVPTANLLREEWLDHLAIDNNDPLTDVKFASG